MILHGDFLSTILALLGKVSKYLKVYFLYSSNPEMDPGFGKPEVKLHNLEEALQDKECQIAITKLDQGFVLGPLQRKILEILKD
jgi:hypothetical protein